VTDWFQQFPSHSTGSIAFGADGALYASAGDGASFNYADYGQTVSAPASGDPANEGGALRSQDIRTGGDPVTLDGSIIRLDPDTGPLWMPMPS
jgi:glucose/arabinose dehydrogenase